MSSPIRSTAGRRPHLCDLSHALIRPGKIARPVPMQAATARLALVATSHEDFSEKLRLAQAAIAQGKTSLDDPRGLFFEANPPWSDAPVAFLFPGQGAQSPGMLRELAVVFPEVRQAFEEFDRGLVAAGVPAGWAADLSSAGIQRNTARRRSSAS